MTPLHQAIELLFGPPLETGFNAHAMDRWGVQSAFLYRGPGLYALVAPSSFKTSIINKRTGATHVLLHAWRADPSTLLGTLEMFYFDLNEPAAPIAQEILGRLSDFFESDDLAGFTPPAPGVY